MDQSEFDWLVAQSEAVSDPEPIAVATLETLAEALAEGQADEVAKWLPETYAHRLGEANGRDESISYEVFLDRVRERDDRDGEGVENADLVARVGAVADALATTVPHDELLELCSQLPDRIGSLFTEEQGVR